MKALLSTIIILFLASVSLAGQWHIDEVDYLGSGGTDTSLKLDSDDLPFISYYKDKQLVLARKEGEGWNVEIVDDKGPFNLFVSLALDSQDRPHIAYFQWYPESDLKYARWTGTEWIIETVDAGDAGPYCSLALDSSDRPHIAYLDWGVNKLKYARWDGDEWLYEHVDTGGDTCNYISLVLDSNDHPHISYQKKDEAYDLRYAHWDGTEWQIETVDTEEEVGKYSSIAIDSNDRPHISYMYYIEAPSTVNLRYAHWDGSQWRIETVDSEGLAGGHTSITLDSADRPCISYYNFHTETTKYARWDGERWLIYDLDPHACGDHTSLALDSSDLPHVSYTGFGDGERFYGLKYAWYEVFFHLLSPERGEVVSTLTPTLDWSDDDNPDLASYTLWWGEDPDFENYNEVTDIGESEHTISGGIEDGDRIWWRVKSVDSGGGEHWAEELDWHFTVYLNFNPDFHLLEPERGEIVPTTTPTLDWEDQKIPNLESYTLWWGEDPDFETYNEVADIGESGYQITEGIEDGDRIWWRVKSVDEEGEEYWAEELDWYFEVDTGGGVDIVDLGADAAGEGVLVAWRLSGDEPAGVRVLRSVGEGEPVAIHENQLPGTATSYLDRLDKGLKPLAPGIEYRYWLEVVEADGTTSRFGPTEVVRIEPEGLVLSLSDPYPSPAGDEVTVCFTLPEDGRVELVVYDLAGRRVATLVEGELTAGRREASWNCGGVSPGVYVCRLTAGGETVSRRLLISR
jgi:hypothetical protein